VVAIKEEENVDSDEEQKVPMALVKD
jgi:hypothetical protein